MLESLNYSFRNPKNIIWVLYRNKQLRNYKKKKNHVVLRGPQLGKQRWRPRIGILRLINNSCSFHSVLQQNLIIVFFLLGYSPTSEFYMPSFRNTLFHLHRRCKQDTAYEDGIECSETSAYKIQTPWNNLKEIIRHSEHGESLNWRTLLLFSTALNFMIGLSWWWTKNDWNLH